MRLVYKERFSILGEEFQACDGSGSVLYETKRAGLFRMEIVIYDRFGSEVGRVKSSSGTINGKEMGNQLPL